MSGWNYIRLEPEFAGRKIELILSGPDPFRTGMVSDILLGTYGELLTYASAAVSSDRWISLSILFLGLLALLFSLVSFSDIREASGYAMLGLLTALFGVCGCTQAISPARSAEMPMHYTDSYDYADILSKVSGYTIEKQFGTSKITKATYKLHLDSTTALDVYLTSESGASVTASAVFKNKTYSAVKQKDGRYLVRVLDISAHQLGDNVKMTGNADGSFTVITSALSYVRSVLKNSTDTKAKDNMAAMYEYYAAVKAYRGE